jgi:hypothetical protein
MDVLHTTVSRWVEGELEKSRLAATLEELGIEAMTGCVSSPTGMEMLSAAGSPKDIFQEAGGQLLVLGEAGTGKSRFMLRLVKQLLADWKEDISLILPVPIKISTWTADASSLPGFLASRMVEQRFRTGRSQNEELIRQGRLALALDGLDEVASEHRAACLDAINEFADTAAGWSLIVTSRFREYSDLAPRKLVAGGAVRLQELTKGALLQMLESGGPELSKLRDLIVQDPGWGAIAATPALLAMLVEGLRDEELSAREVDSVASRLEELMDRFIDKRWAQAS